ncbi:MAG: BsuBI/PstI family type II restriction endonuclease [Burkholderiales bacterium]
MRPLISVEEAELRLQAIFPRSAFDPVMSSPLAAAAVRALIYTDAVHGTEADLIWARPSTVMWMSDEVAAHDEDRERTEWRDAAAKGRRAVVSVLEEWGVPVAAPYADNSRETLRDETFRRWKENAAIRERSDLPKTSSKGRWALESHFVALFDPSLRDGDLEAAIHIWQETHLNPSAKLKVEFAAIESRATTAVTIRLPNTQTTRTLEGGLASLVLKSVVEEWAVARLGKPFVVTISEPGAKIYTGDAQLLAYLGVTIDVSALLPDALLADLSDDPVRFWLVEAVNTDGEINESRKEALLAWAGRQNIQPEQCSFLTAFASRNSAAARRRLKDIAAGTYAYFADEPGFELSWHQIGSESTTRPREE